MLLTSNLTLLLCLRINLRYLLPLDNFHREDHPNKKLEFEEYATLKTNKKTTYILIISAAILCFKISKHLHVSIAKNKSATSKACVSREGLIERKIK